MLIFLRAVARPLKGPAIAVIPWVIVSGSIAGFTLLLQLLFRLEGLPAFWLSVILFLVLAGTIKLGLLANQFAQELPWPGKLDGEAVPPIAQPGATMRRVPAVPKVFPANDEEGAAFANVIPFPRQRQAAHKFQGPQ